MLTMLDDLNVSSSAAALSERAELLRQQIVDRLRQINYRHRQARNLEGVRPQGRWNQQNNVEAHERIAQDQIEFLQSLDAQLYGDGVEVEEEKDEDRGLTAAEVDLLPAIVFKN